MTRKRLAVAGLVVLVVAGAVGALVTGIGPGPGGGGGSDVESFPTATPADASEASDADERTTPAATEAPPPFSLTVDRVEECGRTCRDVTSRLTNQQDTTARNATVYTRIYVGNGTDGDVIWQGTEPLGTIGPGASVTATERVELSYTAALAVERADGWITVQTTVQTTDRTVTFSERRQVA